VSNFCEEYGMTIRSAPQNSLLAGAVLAAAGAAFADVEAGIEA
jgi:hypothetical protein